MAHTLRRRGERGPGFKTGGETYPVHRLDTNSDDTLTNSNGQVCLGAFQPSSSSASPYYCDLVLGTSFLRNVPPLNFGDFVNARLNYTSILKPQVTPSQCERLMVEENVPIIIVLFVLVGLMLIGIIVLYTRRRGAKYGRSEMPKVQGYHANPPKYSTPWDVR
ncbi:hypothetical protein BJV78DRAFT_1279406 [Lactifluus subvellereus]|nr:hypothetical protein BJV78DRAFT_1279406 [Lactifluus subvellereus]